MYAIRSYYAIARTENVFMRAVALGLVVRLAVIEGVRRQVTGHPRGGETVDGLAGQQGGPQGRAAHRQPLLGEEAGPAGLAFGGAVKLLEGGLVVRPQHQQQAASYNFV